MRVSGLEENSLRISLQPNIPPQFTFAPSGLHGEQGLSPFSGQGRKDCIIFVGRFIRKINSRQQLLLQAAHKHQYRQMRRVDFSLRAFYRARLYGLKRKLALIVCGNSCEATRHAKLVVARVTVQTGLIRTPDF